MSLYTPVFPPLHEFDSSQKGPHEGNSVAPLLQNHNYIKYLRDVHLFLSSQTDVLSPPSRPNSPLSDHRVQKVKDTIHDIFNAAEDETSSAKWARASQTLKLGCVRGRHWSVPQTNPCVHEHSTNWILPDEESEWIEWEKKREESRRFRGKTNASQQIGSTVPTPPDSQDPSRASFAGSSQPRNTSRYCPPPGVSSSTLRTAKEKVRKWQASMTSNVCHDITGGSSPAVSRDIVTMAERKRETARLQRSRTLEFSVVKPAAKSLVGKGNKGSTAIRGDSAPAHLRKSKSLKLSQTFKVPVPVPQDTALIDVNKTAIKEPAKTPCVKDDAPKIRDIPETPYLPPSFPTYLETSTPLADSMILIRAKPSPILQASLSTPSAPANPPDDRQPVLEEPVTLSQTNTVERGKRSRVPSTSVDGIPNDLPITPLAKRPRTLSLVINHSEPMPANEALNTVLEQQQDGQPPRCDPTQDIDEPRDPSLGAALPLQNIIDSLEMTSGAPLTPDRNKSMTNADVQDLAEKIPSPTKSVKSYFSTPDSDPADSAVEANLLLESPVSPMLSYAQNASVFLPQITSTQARKRSPTAGRTNFGMGYSSQFDVERHVDRVSELLEKDVDFDEWLRDARTVEMSPD